MKWTVLIIALVMVVCAGAIGQPNQYSTSAPGGAPTPANPTTPESLGLQVPSVVTSSDADPHNSGKITGTDEGQPAVGLCCSSPGVEIYF